MWNGVPAPASVRSASRRIGIVTAGTNVSLNTSRHPVSAVKVHVCPPMCVREDESEHVLVGDVEATNHRAGRRPHRRIGMTRALRIGGGARG